METYLERLRQSLRSGVPPSGEVSAKLQSEPTAEYAAQRALLAWQKLGACTADVLVLVRQAVRWSDDSRLFVGKIAPDVQAALADFDLSLTADGVLAAAPYQPAWLNDRAPCDPPPEPRLCDESFGAEPYLQSIQYPRWKSPAQKEGAWATLTTAPGATRLVILPTGSGKSLCFQLLARFDAGLTVVIVPTVALAIDQQRAASEAFAGWPDVNPIFFSSDDDPEAAARVVREKQTRLLFTSPESCVAGRLRKVLDGFAEEGWLTNLVLDEGHLVETWGAQFRVEFQILAALRRQWLTASGGQLRTYIFSATMTPDCRRLLLELFSEPGAGSESVSRRLRPEMVYFQCDFQGDQARDAALLEALKRLPRPLILYVTKVDDARNYAQLLREAPHGFRRVARFHGETRRGERRELLARWQRNEIDLMVATSAFGVGVDKADVRAVVHACYPENLDRYYQEVGRGGRDGWSSICLFLPTHQDRHEARQLTVTLMGPEKMQERWEAMFHEHEGTAEEYLYYVPVDSRRRGLVGSFTYGENVRWNKRLLLQLHRAKLIEIVDLKFNPPEPGPEADEDPEELALIRVLAFTPTTKGLGDLMAETLADERARFERGFEQLNELLTPRHCVSRPLGKLYDLDESERICGGCTVCRARGKTPDVCPPLTVTTPPTGVHRGVVVQNWPDPLAAREADEFVQAFYLAVTRKRVRHFMAPQRRFDQVLELCARAFPGNSMEHYRIDPFDENTVIATPATETVAIFHAGGESSVAFALAENRTAVHLLPRTALLTDADGRSIYVAQKCKSFHSLEAWTSATW